MTATTLAITSSSIKRWFALGLPAIILWSIGAFGALGLLLGLSSGGVTPGAGSSAGGLTLMWGAVLAFAGVGIVLAMSSLFFRVRRSLLVANVLAGFCSLFFSVLISS